MHARVAYSINQCQVQEVLGKKSLVVAQFFAEWKQGESARKRAKRQESNFHFAARPDNSC